MYIILSIRLHEVLRHLAIQKDDAIFYALHGTGVSNEGRERLNKTEKRLSLKRGKLWNPSS